MSLSAAHDEVIRGAVTHSPQKEPNSTLPIIDRTSCVSNICPREITWLDFELIRMNADSHYRHLGFSEGLRNAPLQFDIVMDDSTLSSNNDIDSLLNRLRESERLRRSAPLLHMIWVFGLIPLPVVNYAILKRRIRDRNIRQDIICLAGHTKRLARKALRFAIYMLSLISWMQLFLSCMASCGSMVTFSKTFFRDILTYSSRSYSSLLPRHLELEASSKNGQVALDFESVGQFMFDLVALNIESRCDYVENKPVCEFRSDSLIFKFSDVFASSFPVFDRLPLIFLTVFTVFFYLAYAIGASVLNTNVIIHVGIYLCQRRGPPLKILMALVKNLWNSTTSNVV